MGLRTKYDAWQREGADKGHILMGVGRDGKYVGRGREGVKLWFKSWVWDRGWRVTCKTRNVREWNDKAACVEHLLWVDANERRQRKEVWTEMHSVWTWYEQRCSQYELGMNKGALVRANQSCRGISKNWNHSLLSLLFRCAWPTRPPSSQALDALPSSHPAATVIQRYLYFYL